SRSQLLLMDAFSMPPATALSRLSPLGQPARSACLPPPPPASIPIPAWPFPPTDNSWLSPTKPASPCLRSTLPAACWALSPVHLLLRPEQVRLPGWISVAREIVYTQ